MSEVKRTPLRVLGARDVMRRAIYAGRDQGDMLGVSGWLGCDCDCDEESVGVSVMHCLIRAGSFEQC